MRSCRLAALSFAVILASGAAWAPQLHAQAYPGKPIRVIIGYAPGGSADAGIRPLARVLEPLLGQPMVIENKPGNAGGVAMEFIAKATPDGYTLYYFDSGPLTVAPHLIKVGYNIITSFTHLGHVCGSGSLLVVHPSTPFNSVAEVIAASNMDEPGFKGFDSTASYGLLGPAGLPPEVVSRLSQAMRMAGEDRNLRDQLNATGCDADFLNPAQTVDKIKADSAKWGRVIKEAGIKVD